MWRCLSQTSPHRVIMSLSYLSPLNQKQSKILIILTCNPIRSKDHPPTEQKKHWKLQTITIRRQKPLSQGQTTLRSPICWMRLRSNRGLLSFRIWGSESRRFKTTSHSSKGTPPSEWMRGRNQIWTRSLSEPFNKTTLLTLAAARTWSFRFQTTKQNPWIRLKNRFSKWHLSTKREILNNNN